MSEYINRESIRKVLMDVCSDENCPMFIAATIDQVIDYEPAADVAPVVHAHWINETPYRALNGDFNKTQECSRCHRTYVSAGNTPYSNHKFCAECGAKMDGPVEWLKL